MIMKTVTYTMMTGKLTMMMMVVAQQMLSITLTTLVYEGGDGNDCFCRHLQRSGLAQLWVSDLAITVIFLNDGQPQVRPPLFHRPVW